MSAAAAASAQSLADVARKESERRQTVQDSGKTYTNQDLKTVPPAPGSAVSTPSDATAAGADAAAAAGASGAATADATPADAAGAAGSGPATPTTGGTAKPAAEEGARDESYWSQRMADLREQLARDETFAAALQNRIDALTTDFVNRDDPAQRSQIGDDRQKALVELERVKKAIEQDKRAIPELEEEARRAGVPAGWLR